MTDEQTVGAGEPVVRTIGASDIVDALGQGLRDFRAAPIFGLFFGGSYAIGGMLIVMTAFALDMSYLSYPLAVGFALIGPFNDTSTFISLCGPGDMRLTKAGRNYQDSDYIRSWLAIQGLDWIRRAVLGQLTSPADWKE